MFQIYFYEFVSIFCRCFETIFHVIFGENTQHIPRGADPRTPLGSKLKTNKIYNKGLVHLEAQKNIEYYSNAHKAYDFIILGLNSLSNVEVNILEYLLSNNKSKIYLKILIPLRHLMDLFFGQKKSIRKKNYLIM